MGLARITGAAILAALLTSLGAQAAETPSAEEMWRIIQAQQSKIEALEAQLANTEQKVDQTDQKVEVAGEMIQQVSDRGAVAATEDRTRIGGYGEMHYNNLDSKEELDFHRFVLFFNHDFSDNVRFFSELELEHSLAGEDAEGEVELEQAYVEYDIGERHRAKTGLFLIPVGILNEVHEPPTFFGVERNPVESNIIPTTWWEGGAGLAGEIAPGFGYDLALTSGLDVPQSGGSAFLIRSGRQKVSEARAEDYAYTGRLRWTGMPGLELGVTGQYQSDVTQGDLGVSATLFEAHADWRHGPFGLRALFARWDLDDASLIAAADPAAAGRDEQLGWYVEPSWRTQLTGVRGELGFFARYNAWDNNAGSSDDTEKTQLNVGLNYWPVPDVVLKADIQRQDNDSGEDDNGFNLGVGYQF